jgi:DNA-binding PadR family transcriptional regulator
MANNELLRHFFGGFVRLHLLYHAAKEPICGVEMIEELGRHGYKLSPGTLYPILHHLAEAGFLSRKDRIVSGKRRKDYRITPRGRKLLVDGRAKLKELFSEVVENRDRRRIAGKGGA